MKIIRFRVCAIKPIGTKEKKRKREGEVSHQRRGRWHWVNGGRSGLARAGIEQQRGVLGVDFRRIKSRLIP